MRSSNIGHRLKHGFALQQIPSISSTRCTMCIVHTCPRGIQIWSYLSKYFHFLINVCFGERRGRIFGNPSPELTCWISHLKQDKPRVLCRGEKEQKGRNYNYLYDCIVFFLIMYCLPIFSVKEGVKQDLKKKRELSKQNQVGIVGVIDLGPLL